MRPIITVLTDFGTADGCVAEVKGTIMSRAPEAVFVDAAQSALLGLAGDVPVLLGATRR